MMATVEQQAPPLAAGDKLSREEFLRRWEANPGIKRAELIGGTVYMPSPVSAKHGRMELEVGGLFWTYKNATPGTDSGHNTTSFLLEDSPQPDLYLCILREYGGKSWEEKGFLHGVPEMLAEICRSSVAYDLHQKLELYQAAGVPEYLAVLTYEREIRWHILVDSSYQLMPPGLDGIWRSRIFPGLWLDGTALLEGRSAQVLATLQQGLQSPEHQAFVEQLARQKESRKR